MSSQLTQLSINLLIDDVNSSLIQPFKIFFQFVKRKRSHRKNAIPDRGKLALAVVATCHLTILTIDIYCTNYRLDIYYLLNGHTKSTVTSINVVNPMAPTGEWGTRTTTYDCTWCLMRNNSNCRPLQNRTQRCHIIIVALSVLKPHLAAAICTCITKPEL